nr:MAG TPA: outer capsid protein sigma-1 attachment protein [Caudoviricetes sp.]
MTDKDLIAALRRMKVETGSLVCWGCGHEHNCGIRGCAVMRAAAERLEQLKEQAGVRDG